jgi:hypothetical protein
MRVWDGKINFNRKLRPGNLRESNRMFLSRFLTILHCGGVAQVARATVS